MEMEKKKTSAVYARLIEFFSKRVVRLCCIGAVLLLSLLFMFLLDEYNVVRDKYLSFLNNNFFGKLLDFFKLEPFNAMWCAWVIFLTAFSVGFFFLLASFTSVPFVNKRTEKNRELFKKEIHTRILFYFIYYIVVALICAAGVFMAYMLGAYASLKDAPSEVYMNLLYVALLCVMFVVLIPLFVILICLLLHLCLRFIGWILYLIDQFKKDITASNGFKNEKAVRLLKNARGEGMGDPADSENFPTAEGEIFPSLMKIDKTYAPTEGEEDTDAEMMTAPSGVSLEELALEFQSFAAKKNIYYELPTIRSFVSGLAASRLIILEGLSGTGKSTMPRLFCEFMGTKAFFAPVQATWRDKSDMLGYFSEFQKTFKSTDFLKTLYAASYKEDMNMMVLDEMNISRAEYYFADFLSVLEYPSEDWKVRVIEPNSAMILPARLEDGYVSIPTNTWIVGTANTDDSTYTITDKVYDRAIVLDFEDKFKPLSGSEDTAAIPVNMTATQLVDMFEQAQSDTSKTLNAYDMEKFDKICEYVSNSFDVRFGNRIMVQINKFVPVYVALGGTKEEALDFMFARKILRKFDDLFEDYVKENLIGLLKLLHTTYGKGVFKETEKSISKLLKRLV